MVRLLVVMMLICTLCPNLAAQDDAQEESISRKLISAIMTGDIDAVQKSIDSGADVNAIGKHGFTPYEAARRAGFAQIAKLLVEKGAETNVNVPTNDEFIELFLSEKFNDKTPACVVLIARDGKVVMQKAFGQADMKKKTKAKRDTKFRIGSVTKQFTSAAILKLEEEGKLSIDDKLSKYLPDFTRADEVTLRQLLTHTSGIQSYTSKAGFWELANDPMTEKEIIDTVRKDEFEFEPGDRYSYCNTGYMMLGHIVGKVSGKVLDEYLKDNFFDPLGMKNTGIYSKTNRYENEATGHTDGGDGFEATESIEMSWAGGAGAMYSTVGDLFLWNEALFANKILKKETLDRAFAPTKLNDGSISQYGFGWALGGNRGLNSISHGGGLPGFVTHLSRYPSVNTTVAVVINATTSGDMLPAAAVEKLVVDTYLWESMKPREVLIVDDTIEPKTFEAFVGEYDYGPASMIVTVDDDKVFAQLAGQPNHQIFPSAPNKFFWKVVDAQVEFVLDENGKTIRALHTQNGSTSSNARLPDRFKVDEKRLEKYAGKYDYGGGVMTVTRHGQRLNAQITGQPALEIYPKSDSVFEWRVVKAKVEFVLGKDGNVEKVIHTQGGRSFDALRFPAVKEIKLSDEKLEEYCGSYNLGFLVGKMVISRDGEKMFGKLGSQPKLAVVPSAEDELSWVDVNATMKFVRDKDGTIIRGDFAQAGRTFKGQKAAAKAGK